MYLLCTLKCTWSEALSYHVGEVCVKFNPMRPRDTYMYQWNGWSSVYIVMAWHLNQCWLIFNWTLMNTFSYEAWWRHQMETFSTLLALCAGNLMVTGEFPSQRPVTRNFDVFFDLSLNKRFSKQVRRQWSETTSGSLWRQSNGQIWNLMGKMPFPQAAMWQWLWLPYW